MDRPRRGVGERTVPKAADLRALIAVLLFLMITGAVAADTEQSATYPHSANTTVERLAQEHAPLQVYDNYDLTGPSSRILHGVELQACSQSCQSESQCRAFSYDKWRRQCSLKEAVGSFRFEPRSISGIDPNATPPQISSLPIVIECSAENILAQSGFKSTGASSLEQCQKICEGDNDCVAFTFVNAQQQCKLFQTADRVVADQSVVSGVKRQLSSSSEQNSNTSCGPFSKDATRIEEEAYRAARGDIEKLRSYVTSCSVCSFANDARQESASLERKQREGAEKQTYEAARGDESKLRQYLSSCIICSDAGEARAGVAWFQKQREQAEQASREEAQYYAARGNVDRLSDYIRECQICAYQQAASQQVQQLQHDAKIFTFHVCNRSKRKAYVAVSGRKNPDASEWTVAGWWNIAPGDCTDIGPFARGWFYYMGDAEGGKRGWYGSAINLCVLNARFEKINYGGRCISGELLKKFNGAVVTEPDYYWNLGN